MLMATVTFCWTRSPWVVVSPLGKHYIWGFQRSPSWAQPRHHGLLARSQASVGIGSFVVYNDEQYIDLARLRSTDYVYMGRLRKGLRGMVAESDAGNPDKYTKAVETAYRSMWKEWCSK